MNGKLQPKFVKKHRKLPSTLPHFYPPVDHLNGGGETSAVRRKQKNSPKNSGCFLLERPAQKGIVLTCPAGPTSGPAFAHRLAADRLGTDAELNAAEIDPPALQIDVDQHGRMLLRDDLGPPGDARGRHLGGPPGGLLRGLLRQPALCERVAEPLHGSGDRRRLLLGLAVVQDRPSLNTQLGQARKELGHIATRHAEVVVLLHIGGLHIFGQDLQNSCWRLLEGRRLTPFQPSADNSAVSVIHHRTCALLRRGTNLGSEHYFFEQFSEFCCKELLFSQTI